MIREPGVITARSRISIDRQPGIRDIAEGKVQKNWFLPKEAVKSICYTYHILSWKTFGVHIYCIKQQNKFHSDDFVNGIHHRMQCKIFNETKQYLVQNVVKQNIVRLPLILLLIYAITYKNAFFSKFAFQFARTFDQV